MEEEVTLLQQKDRLEFGGRVREAGKRIAKGKKPSGRPRQRRTNRIQYDRKRAENSEEMTNYRKEA